jgi:hypothetical protein
VKHIAIRVEFLDCDWEFFCYGTEVSTKKKKCVCVCVSEWEREKGCVERVRN